MTSKQIKIGSIPSSVSHKEQEQYAKWFHLGAMAERTRIRKLIANACEWTPRQFSHMEADDMAITIESYKELMKELVT